MQLYPPTAAKRLNSRIGQEICQSERKEYHHKGDHRKGIDCGLGPLEETLRDGKIGVSGLDDSIRRLGRYDNIVVARFVVYRYFVELLVRVILGDVRGVVRSTPVVDYVCV